MAIQATLQPNKARRVTGGKETQLTRRRYQGGSLFKRGKRRKVWVARWREDVIKQDGSRGRRHRTEVLGLVTDIPTRRQAQEILHERLRPLNSGASKPQSVIGFLEYAEQQWSDLVLPTLKLSTQHSYGVMLKKHLIPYFGSFRLCDITRQDVQQFIIDKFKLGLAWQTVRNVWIVLSSILDSAVRYEYLSANAAHGVRFPAKPPHYAPKILNVDSIGQILLHLSEPYRTMLVLIVLTGLRIGELLALRWRVVDLKAGTLYICQSVYKDKFQTPKSHKGIRTIPIGPAVCRLLESHLQRSLHISSDDLLFPWGNGKPYSEPYLLQHVLQPAGEAAGIGRVTWHQFRHIHTSYLHNLKVPKKIVQEQLGHASLETTFNVYTHVVEDAHREAICDLERLLFPNVPKFEESQTSGGFVN